MYNKIVFTCLKVYFDHFLIFSQLLSTPYSPSFTFFLFQTLLKQKNKTKKTKPKRWETPCRRTENADSSNHWICFMLTNSIWGYCLLSNMVVILSTLNSKRKNNYFALLTGIKDNFFSMDGTLCLLPFPWRFAWDNNKFVQWLCILSQSL